MNAKQILADNLRKFSGGTDTQAFRERIESKSGVSARTIGNMMSAGNGVNPTLANIESVAKALGYTAAQILDPSLGEVARSEDRQHLSQPAQSIISRLAELEQAHNSPPELYELIERAIDLAAPRKPRGAPWAEGIKGE